MGGQRINVFSKFFLSFCSSAKKAGICPCIYDDLLNAPTSIRCELRMI